MLSSCALAHHAAPHPGLTPLPNASSLQCAPLVNPEALRTPCFPHTSPQTSHNPRNTHRTQHITHSTPQSFAIRHLPHWRRGSSGDETTQSRAAAEMHALRGAPLHPHVMRVAISHYPPMCSGNVECTASNLPISSPRKTTRSTRTMDVHYPRASSR